MIAILYFIKIDRVLYLLFENVKLLKEDQCMGKVYVKI